MRKFGLEWLWRIKEEPHLGQRYWNDGRVLLRLLATRVLPLVILNWWLRLRYQGNDLVVKQWHDCESLTVALCGLATAQNIDRVIPIFRNAISTQKKIVIDLSNVYMIDQRVLGLLLMLRKKLKSSGASPILQGVSPSLRRIFRLNGLEFLLTERPMS
jgi:N-acetylglucosaminyldiphosphoundecaprenol N-acetyl-beta-D-mannosaminyltransferase